MWERLIRSICRILVVAEQRATEEVLAMELVEAERLLNDGPLMPVYDDPDQPQVLRPSGTVKRYIRSAYLLEGT